uniref:Uncharacterized protein n=1 Tax=Panagrolaimus davidi TaxID=227884 RepID=A0A914QMG9_9BILA
MITVIFRTEKDREDGSLKIAQKFSKVVKINASWNELSKLDSELQLAADRLEIKKSRQLTITVTCSKDIVNVRLALDDKEHVSTKSSKPSTPTKQKEEKEVEKIQDEITDKSQKNVETAEVGTQTESWNEKMMRECALVSSWALLIKQKEKK